MFFQRGNIVIYLWSRKKFYKQFRAGVSNSNLCKGHIPKIKWFACRSLSEKAITGLNLQEICQNKLNLIKIYNILSFWDAHGPHKCIRRATCGPRAACLRPLVWSLFSYIRHKSISNGMSYWVSVKALKNSS